MGTEASEDKLEPAIAKALEEWAITLMQERTGPPIPGMFLADSGKRYRDNSFEIVNLFEAIHEAAPDAIARMLQAGAASYIRE